MPPPGDNLRQLFQYKDVPARRTTCSGASAVASLDISGRQHTKATAMLYGDMSTWSHLINECLQVFAYCHFTST